MSQALIVIQARTGSTRFPNKINQLIGGRRMLDVVIDRARQTGLKWILARPQDYPQVAEEDVLGRFHATLSALDPEEDMYDPIIRCTADTPLLDPGLLLSVLAAFREGSYDLVSTCPAWDGLDVEVLSRQGLARAHALATEPRDREHVTPYLKRHGSWKEIPLEGPPLRWSVDTPEGLDFVRAVFRLCEHCREGQPHRMRDFRPNWAIHDVYGLHDGGRPEPLACEAFDLLEAHTGGSIYVSL